MQTINLTLQGKYLTAEDESNKEFAVVGDNRDYYIHFDIDEPKRAMFAVFSEREKDCRTPRQESVLIDENGLVNVPMWILKQGGFSVGVVSDGFASTPLYIYVVGSIIDKTGIQTEDPPPSQVEQLIKLVNDLQMKGIDEAEMKRLIGEYLKENHISPDDLPIATKESLGVVKVGDGLLIDSSGTMSVDIAEGIEADNTKPVSSAMVHTEIGNINALLETI